MGCGCRNVSISQKVQIFGERSILYGGLRGSIWFLNIFIWFLGGAKVWVKMLFFIENLKTDTGQFFCLICGYCYETMCKSSIWSNLFHLGVCQMSSQVVNIEWKKVKILTKKVTQIRASQIRVSQIGASQIRVSQIRASQIRATEISSNHLKLQITQNIHNLGTHFVHTHMESNQRNGTFWHRFTSISTHYQKWLSHPSFDPT